MWDRIVLVLDHCFFVTFPICFLIDSVIGLGQLRAD